MRGIERLNKYLKIFNQESGEYLNFIGDESKNYPSLSGFIKINDFDNGSIGNITEYTMQISDFFIDQLEVDKASGNLLDFILETYYEHRRLKDELDIDYYNRTKEDLFDNKISNLAIKKKLEDFGTNIEVIDGIGGDSAYYGISYYENNGDFQLIGENVVKKAIFSQAGGRPYFFRVIMSDVFPSEYKNIVDIINEYKAGGVNYIVELSEFFSQAIAFFDVSFYEYEENKLDVSPVVTAGFYGT